MDVVQRVSAIRRSVLTSTLRDPFQDLARSSPEPQCRRCELFAASPAGYPRGLDKYQRLYDEYAYKRKRWNLREMYLEQRSFGSPGVRR